MVAKDQGETEPHDRSIRRWKLVIIALIILIIVIALTALTVTVCYRQSMDLHQPVKDSMKNYTQYRPTQYGPTQYRPTQYRPTQYGPTQYRQYVDNVKQRFKTHLPDVAQSFWLPANMHTFIQLSLTSRDKPHAPRVDQDSANPRIISERSMTFDHLLSEIDASPGSRILVVGQPGIGKTTLLQRITRSWAQDKALSSCWILLHIVLRDLMLLQHAPNLTTFLSFMGSITLPPDIETFVLESDGKGLCFIADGLDEYPAGYEDETNFIFTELIGAQKPNIKLPQSTVVISSRPAVASQVRHLFNKSVEVLGFGDDQINEYIQAKYGEDKSFSKYLDGHPHIKHTCYIPLHLAMLVYLKDSLHDNLPETETEVYEQFIFHTLIRDFCKSLTSSCSLRITLPTSLNDINKLPEVESLLFHIANLSYVGIQKRQSIFTKVEPVLQHTKSSLLVVDKMSVLQPTTYSFPHLTIQEFLAAFYFNTYLSQQEQKRVLAEYSFHQTKFNVDLVVWKFYCGLKRNENQTMFLEFFKLLYNARLPLHQWSNLPYHCAHEANSQIASQKLISLTGGIAEINIVSDYDAASFAFVAVSAAQNLQEITLRFLTFSKKLSKFFLHKLCNATTNYSQLRKVALIQIGPSNVGCFLQKSPNLESLTVDDYWEELQSEDDWENLQSGDAVALILPPYGTTLMNIRHIHLNGLHIGDKGVKKLSQLLQDLMFIETLSLSGNSISNNGAAAIADLMKAFPHLQHVHLDSNHIGDKGIEKLSQHLQDSIFIETLSLRNNSISSNGASAIADLMKSLPHLRHVHLDSNHIGDKGIEKLSQLLQDSIFLETLSLNHNGISDDGASAIADLMKTIQHVYLSFNHIGGHGAASLWNHSIHECRNLSLPYNVIGVDRPDVFISALNGTVNNGYEGNKSCQLQVSLKHNGLLCSDLRDIHTISKRFPKRVTLIAGHDCLEMNDKMLNRFKYSVGKIYLPSSQDFLPFYFSPLQHKAGKNYRLYNVWLQWIAYAVCTFHIFHSTRTKLWVFLYFSCCLGLFILSSFDYFVQVNYFIFMLSLLWSWIVVGRLIIFRVSLLFFKQQCCHRFIFRACSL